MEHATDIRALLIELYESGKKSDAQAQERSKRMLNLDPDEAQLLHMLIRSSHRSRILEIGTSNGYSTIWLAWAASETGGRVISIDRNPQKQELAEANLSRAGLRSLVDLKCGDATQILVDLPGPFDCVFFDADRYSAPEQLRLLLPRLTPDVFLFADNALTHPQEIAAYLQTLETLPQFAKMVLPIGKGLSVAYRSTVK